MTTPKVIELAEEIKSIGHAVGYDAGYAEGFKAGVKVREGEVDNSRIFKKLLAWHVSAQGGKLEIAIGKYGQPAPVIVYEHPIHLGDHPSSGDMLDASDFDTRTVTVRTMRK